MLTFPNGFLSWRPIKQIISGKWRPDDGKKYQTVAVRGIPGITAKVYKSLSGKGYISYVLTYSLLGKRKVEFFADPAKAGAAGEDAIRRIANSEARVLELANRDRDIYLRAKEITEPFGVDLDVVAAEWADLKTTLNGKGTPADAGRCFMQHQGKELPKISVADAVKKCLAKAREDGKSKVRMHELDFYLNKFTESTHCEVSSLTPHLISDYAR